jgi:hypothetical protein
MKKFTKRFQVWERSEGTYYTLKEFDSLEEAVLDQKYTDDWYVTEAFDKYGENVKIVNYDWPQSS